MTTDDRPAAETAAEGQNVIVLSFEDSDALREALGYIGNSNAPVCIDNGLAVIDGRTHQLWEDFDEAMAEAR